MKKVSDLIGPIIFFSSLLFCCAKTISVNEVNSTHHDNAVMKKELIEGILRKVCNISMNTFSNKSSAEKATLLVKIEEKLNKSAQALGEHGNKYVKLIMKGVKSMAFSKHQNPQPDKPVMNTFLRTASENNQEHTKSKLVNDIASKIEALAKEYIKDATTKEDRKLAIESLKKKLMESADRTQAVLHKKDEIRSYVNLITKGIEMMMQRNGDTKSRKKMEFVFNNNVDINKDANDQNEVYNEPIKDAEGAPISSNDIGIHNFAKKPVSVVFKYNKRNNSGSMLSCDDTLEETCKKVKLVKTFKCQSDNRDVPILKLCDGVGDCLDFSDEQQCAKIAIESIESAGRLLTHIDTSISRNCYRDIVDESLISKQNHILNNVLQNQLTFLHKHSLEGSAIYSRRVYTTDSHSIRKTVNEAVTVVDTLSSALENSLCYNLYENKVRRRKFDTQYKDIVEDVMRTTTFSPEICKCNKQNCISKCSPACEQICWETYSLTQYLCQAVTGERTVSIDLVCDGKLDCYDESDEDSCSPDTSLSRFEATTMFKYILETIKNKASLVSFESIRNRLLNLHVLVTKLQKVTIKRHPDALEVKQVREKAFEELKAIYESGLRYILSPQESLDMYVFLHSINERLVSALKRSHTGNERVISRDGCVCRGTQCAMLKCPRTCTRACAVKPMLTRYYCGGVNVSETNNSVPIDFICNGKMNCPDGDDEKHCKTDVCRKHHLTVLRHNLRDVGEVHQGTAMGEALMSWKTKVTASLMVAEKQIRPSPLELRKVVHEILHDLVMSYSTVEDSRRAETSPVFREYLMCAERVMDLLRSCGK